MAASLPGEAREPASKYCRPQHSLQNPSALILSTRLSRTELFRRKVRSSLVLPSAVTCGVDRINLG
jgi:hypothetical protein